MLKILIAFNSLLFSQSNSLKTKALIDEVKGTVSILRQGDIFNAEKDMNIFIYDIIQTDVYSEARIKYEDGSYFYIREKSIVSLQPLNNNAIGRCFKIEKGKVWGIVKKSKQCETKFETPAAVANIYGTKVEVDVKTGSEWEIIKIGCADGRFEVFYYENGKRKCIVLSKGFMVLLIKEGEIVLIGYKERSIAGYGIIGDPHGPITPKVLTSLLLALGGGVLGTATYLIVVASPSEPG